MRKKRRKYARIQINNIGDGKLLKKKLNFATLDMVLDIYIIKAKERGK